MGYGIQKPADELVIRGRFENADGSPIVGAAVHECFLGAPPANCGTYIDLDLAPSHTDHLGQFEWTLSVPELDKMYYLWPPGAWQTGCFVVVAAKDCRTIGYIVASGEELATSSVVIKSLPQIEMHGFVEDERGRPVSSAKVSICLYILPVGRGPYTDAPVNFWLRKSGKVETHVVSTAEDGRFVIPHVPALPGELCFTVEHPDFARLETSCCPPYPEVRFVMHSGAQVSLQVQLPNGTSAEGFLFVVEGCPDGSSNSTYRDATTNESGVCEFCALPVGSYTLRYCRGPSIQWAVPSIAVRDLREGERRQITAVAVNGSVLRGRVHETESKNPVPQVFLRIESEVYPGKPSTFQTTHTDDAGEFVFPVPIEPGPIEVMLMGRCRGARLGRFVTVVVSPEPRTDVTLYLDPVRDRQLEYEDEDDDVENEES